MNEHSEQQNISNGSPAEPEMMVLIKKLQQHLGFLEKKIDILIAGQSHRPFNGGRRFSKPDHSGGNFRQRSRTEGGNRSNERNFGRTSSFDPSRGGGGHGFGHRKKQPFRQKKSWH